MEKDNSKRWIAVLLAILTIFILYRMLVDTDLLLTGQKYEHGSAVVEKILNIKENQSLAQHTQGGITSTEITFLAKYKGETVEAMQSISSMTANNRIVEVGDRVMLIKFPGGPGQPERWIMENYYRIPWVALVGAVFAVLLIIFGRKTGLYSLIGLVLSVAMIFFIFIPMVLQGKNIYFWTLVTVFYSIFLTVYLITGWSDKTLATILGCVFGTLVAALLSVIMTKYLYLSGSYDDATLALHRLHSVTPIDLRALIFAGITIGALGAVMDVAMDISSSLYEIKLHAKHVGFMELYKSGLTIGRDIMGTMTNTLVLAYIGGSFSSVLLRVIHSSSTLLLFNAELIVVDLLQALLGSLALLLTMPLTAFFAALLYSSKS